MEDVDDRQEAAFAILVLMMIVVPMLALVMCVFLMGYLAAFGDHHASATAFGWLTDHHRDKHGRSVTDVGAVCWEWPLSVATAYILYQSAELVALVRREFF